MAAHPEQSTKISGARWSAISGVLLCATWAPMAIVIPRLPDLDSAAEVDQFWDDNLVLMQAVIASVSLGFVFLFVFLGGLAEWLQRAGSAIAFTAFGSAVTFMTALNVALGLDIAAGLLRDAGSVDTFSRASRLIALRSRGPRSGGSAACPVHG